MAEKIKLNKNTLREQNQALRLYQEFLPTLELRKQQLQTELRKLEAHIRETRAAFEQRVAGAAPWSAMLERAMPWLRDLVALEGVQVGKGNVAGVTVPVFEGARFAPSHYSLAGTPPFYDAAVAFLQGAISAREELGVLDQQHALLQAELTRTTQRINLYEKVLIPETKENIRRIKVYLGDQQTAAVCRAKIAKAKLLAKAAAGGA
jgi:V/A-type H+-transporting ATPase subunit D